MFALVDCNNFYASCERVFNPGLIGKPVVVLSNNDGCVIARSNEAKALAIPMGAPAFLYEKIFEKGQVNVFSSNYALYGDMSSRVMNILSSFTPDIEIYSIDESFLRFEGFCLFDLREVGLEMIEKVKKCTGIPISVGIAPTKSLAKIANKIAKKFSKKTGGVCSLDSQEKIDKALEYTKIEDVWGIGKQHAKKLQEIGVSNALQFTRLPNEYVRKEMTEVGLRLKRDLSGEKILELEEPAIKKNIAVTRAFEKMYSEYHEIRERVSTYCSRGAYKLRKQQSCCNMVYVFLHTNPHRQDLKQYRCNIAVQLVFPTNSTIELTKAALSGLAEIFRQGYEYKKAGIILTGLVPENQRQLPLFTTINPKHEQLMKTIDLLNQNQSGKVKFGGQDLGRTWKVRQEKFSRRYTTRFEEILWIHAK
ncbi:Y-family DNA polymerase [Zunongwangia sp. H14]|uniref:Y-family DNA polymerase n=1 Tax=Zunongwangia sp. H14 TaxID=3240792 RepID=UPI00356708D2